MEVHHVTQLNMRRDKGFWHLFKLRPSSGPVIRPWAALPCSVTGLGGLFGAAVPSSSARQVKRCPLLLVASCS